MWSVSMLLVTKRPTKWKNRSKKAEIKKKRVCFRVCWGENPALRGKKKNYAFTPVSQWANARTKSEECEIQRPVLLFFCCWIASLPRVLVVKFSLLVHKMLSQFSWQPCWCLILSIFQKKRCEIDGDFLIGMNFWWLSIGFTKLVRYPPRWLFLCPWMWP